MLENHNIWRSWSRQLHKWGIESLVVTLLESFSAFDDIFLHIIYLIEPFAFGNKNNHNVQAFLALFGDEQARSSFLAILKDTDV
ncbi:MAG: hypothetical protein ACPL4H_04145 [Anaerolineales bacterium]